MSGTKLEVIIMNLFLKTEVNRHLRWLIGVNPRLCRRDYQMTHETVQRLRFASWRGECRYDHCQDHNECTS
jgi:hypothetical protein